MKKTLFNTTILILFFLLSTSCNGVSNVKPGTEKDYDFSKTISLEYKKYEGVNPLNGFMEFGNGAATKFPHSLVYLPVAINLIMKEEDEFNFEQVEEQLNESKENGLQAVIRFIMDSPNEISYIPQYLIDNGVKTFNYSYEGSSGIMIDYNSEYFISQICKFIKAFSIYDGDPRIASIQTGIIGHWGEQHIYLAENTKGFTSDFKIKDETWEKFFAAWGENFKTTKLSTRNPSLAGHKKYDLIGYYNDMICSESDDKYFDQLMATKNANQNAWKNSPCSGEIAPGLQVDLLTAIVQKKLSSKIYTKYVEDISKYHISCAIFNNLFYPEELFKNSGVLSCSEAFLQKYQKELLQAQSLMGYDLYIESAKLESGNKKINVEVSSGNKGVSPFPYKWEVEIALFNGKKICQKFYPDWSFTEILNNGTSKKLIFTSETSVLENNEYTVLMRIINPMENGLPVKFSNLSQDADVEGYITLGKLKL